MKSNDFFKAQAPVRVDASERNVEAIRQSRAAFAAALEEMRPLEQALEAAIFPLDPEEPRTAAEMEARREAEEHLSVLREGAWALGFRDLRLARFDGGPGINNLV